MQLAGYRSKVLNKEYIHVPVLLTEVVNNLVTSKKGVYVDATYGRGGHSSRILGQLSAEAYVVAIDRDVSAIDSAKLFASKDPRLMPFHSLYSELEIVLERIGITGVEGILMDLGVSSPQLDDPERGFSFQTEGPLDMRMDQSINLTAHRWINNASETEIDSILKELGDEKLDEKKLYNAGTFQIVGSALNICPESIPNKIKKDYEKKLKQLVKGNKQ